MNKHATMRLARQGCIQQYHAHRNEFHLTPQEEAADAIASLENRSRYLAQSADTEAGRHGRLPRRNPLKLFVFPELNDDREPELPDGWRAPNTPEEGF